MTVRVRFAPSPTGHLHVGGCRTALYNWLFARHHGGVFVLRSDDTDLERNSPEYQQDILDGLTWLGLDWDEGLVVGGPHGTYRQSDRFDRYRQVAANLVAAGHAYHDGATAEQLEEIRRSAAQVSESPVYDGRHRLDPTEAERRIAAGDPPPIRFAVPRPGTTGFEDEVRGEVVFDHSNVDDFVILRGDGTPTYHLASTVDDVDYGITHVIRGEDILSSTPKHLLLTGALGAPPPRYAHLSLLNGPDGKKLSKRHGHTALRAFREAGFLPQAMVNFLAILGWSPGEDREIVSLEEMVDLFDLGAVSRNPAVFDVAKLEWMNGVYVRGMAVSDFATATRPLVEADLGRSLTGTEASSLAFILPHVQERARLLDEVPAQVRFLFDEAVELDQASWDEVMAGPDAVEALAAGKGALADAEWTAEGIEGALRAMLATTGLSAKHGLQPLRVAITGSKVSPPLFESIAVLDRERVLRRLDRASRLLV